MRISIPIQEDSWNSTPMDELDFVIGEAWVTIHIKGDDRKIAVDKEDFARIARFCGYK